MKMMPEMYSVLFNHRKYVYRYIQSKGRVEQEQKAMFYRLA